MVLKIRRAYTIVIKIAVKQAEATSIINNNQLLITKKKEKYIKSKEAVNKKKLKTATIKEDGRPESHSDALAKRRKGSLSHRFTKLWQQRQQREK